MRVLINGETKDVRDSITLAELKKELKLEGKIAIELNKNIVPHSLHQQTKLQVDDQIEIVNAIGGG